MTLLNRTRAHSLMEEAGLDVLIATSPDNVRYMTDYDCISHRITPSVRVFAMLPREVDAARALVVPSLEVDAWAEMPSGVDDVVAYGTLYRESQRTTGFATDDAHIFQTTMAAETHSDAVQALKSVVERRGYTSGAIGIDESGLDPATWSELVATFPHARISPAAQLLRKVRMVKTSEELRRLRESARIAEAGIRSIYSTAAIGVSEEELANGFKAEVSRLGGTPEFWVVCGGRRTAHTHPRASSYPLRAGDLLKLDVGCTYEGYWSDIGRTKVIGQPTDQQVETHRALVAGLRSAIDYVKPGIRASEVFEVAVGAVRDAGISTYQRHHCGHGIGISVYDSPVIQPRQYTGIYGFGDEDPRLEVGMVLNLETPYYLLGDFGLIVEDTVIVEEEGAVQITTLDHDFALVPGLDAELVR